MFLDALSRPGLELVEVPIGHADGRHTEVAAFGSRMQRRENFLIGQITRGAVEDQGIRM